MDEGLGRVSRFSKCILTLDRIYKGYLDGMLDMVM